MEFHIILTLSLPVPNGARTATIIRTVTADPGSTRAGLLGWVLKQVSEEMRSANILFFSAEPNMLPTALKAVKC